MMPFTVELNKLNSQIEELEVKIDSIKSNDYDFHVFKQRTTKVPYYKMNLFLAYKDRFKLEVTRESYGNELYVRVAGDKRKVALIVKFEKDLDSLIKEAIFEISKKYEVRTRMDSVRLKKKIYEHVKDYLMRVNK